MTKGKNEIAPGRAAGGQNSGYGKVPGYGNVPVGNAYGSIPGRNCVAENSILSANGLSAPSLTLSIEDFAGAAGGQDVAGAIQDDDSPPPGYGVVDASAMRAIDYTLAQGAQASVPDSDAIWAQLYASFNQDIQNRMAFPSNGIKQLSSTNYMMEGVDPKHRMGDLLASCLTIYYQKRPPVPFFEWLDSKSDYDQLNVLREAAELASGIDQVIKPSTVRSFIRGVAYLDANARTSYKITITNGKLYQNGKLFDTTKMSTVFSGTGHAIFVQDPKGTFYSATHKYGQFHHSSFLSGAGVRSAGEWIVNQGILKWLSAKSGHYKPEMYHYVQGIEYLKDRGVVTAQTTARVYDNQGAMNLHAMSLLDPAVASQWSVWG